MKKSIVVEIEREDKNVYEDIYAKVEFYIISLWLLFLLIIILTVDIPIYFGVDRIFIGFSELLKRNIIPLIALFLLFYGMVLCIKYKYKFRGTMQLPIKIKDIKNINYEHLTFLTTYIIPLICIDIREVRYLLVFITLIVSIGCIYIKTDLFYANPTLALLGYHIYKVETNHSKCPKSIFISHGKLYKGESVQYIQMDKNIFYVGRVKK